jgi:hypothetical protein
MPSQLVPAALTPTRSQLQSTFDSLVGPYVDYCRNVSRRSMALSIESCTLLLHLCRHFQAESVCDLGSGFTSFVLAKYAATAGHPVRVVSVDDSSEWLLRTREFLHRYGYPTGGLMSYDAWKGNTDHYDVIVHDFSSGEQRDQSMVAAARRCNKALLFDDANHAGHSAQMVAVCDVYGLTPVDVKALTYDQVRRFARLAVR